ncbi:MAG: glycosyltransferase [Desulfomonilaceae bacterium]
MTDIAKRNLSSLSVNFDSSHVVAQTSGRFSLRLSPEVTNEDVFLVVDIYDLDNRIHPGGHLGWWSFRTDSVGDRLNGKISISGNRALVAIDGIECFNRWINEDEVPFRRLVANAVLRSNTTNAIVHLDEVPVFRTRKDHEAYRATFSRNWDSPLFADAWFIHPQKITVRIVAPNIFLQDSVGNFCLDVYKLCIQNGISTEMYAGRCDLAINDIVRKIGNLQEDSTPDDTLLYFFSTYDPRLDQIAGLSFRKKIVYFHGITKPELLQVFDLELSKSCSQGLQQLPSLSKFDLLVANSVASANVLARETERELRNIKVVPPRLVSAEQQKCERGEDTRQDRHLGAHLLYVGRIKSHKKIEDLIEMFGAYIELDPAAECWIVGGQADQAYRSYLNWVVDHRLGAGCQKIRWFGNVSDEQLCRIYAEADAYVSMSEDEGFCLPLVEAMLAGVPVFAYGVEAVREVLGQAGIVFHEKDFKSISALIRSLLTNRKRLERVIERQHERSRYWLAAMDGRGVLSLFDPALS